MNVFNSRIITNIQFKHRGLLPFAYLSSVLTTSQLPIFYIIALLICYKFVCIRLLQLVTSNKEQWHVGKHPSKMCAIRFEPYHFYLGLFFI